MTKSDVVCTMPQLERCSRGKIFFQKGRLQCLPLFSPIVALGLGVQNLYLGWRRPWAPP